MNVALRDLIALKQMPTVSAILSRRAPYPKRARVLCTSSECGTRARRAWEKRYIKDLAEPSLDHRSRRNTVPYSR